MQRLREDVDAAARSDAKVLIVGETGVGKEIVARMIHETGRRRTRNFVTINCAGLPDSLLESELFGHVRGSFTGAYRDKPGLAAMAHNGTLFLDELGETSLRMQALLLRFVENGEIQRVGSDRIDGRVDVRIIAATNRNLAKRIGEGEFREDLYYRLNVIRLAIPPLRERGDDVLILARQFIDRFCKDLSKKSLSLAPSAVDELKTYAWPGNVRELQNCIERAVILTEGDAIHQRHLNLSFRQVSSPQPVASPWDQIDLSGTLAEAQRRVAGEVERRKIELALHEARGNAVHAADALQLAHRVLVQKLKTYGLN